MNRPPLPTGAPRRVQRGFTLIEALIALLVMSFGMLALAGMQTTFSRNGDLAKQRTEAMRLAQQRLEQLRSFGSETAWNALAGGTDTVTTNAAYTRTATLAGANTDMFRAASVTVAWTDRAGVAQEVRLDSVISRTDPADAGYVGNPLPQNTILRRPRNRQINIPIPAIDLGQGQSSYQLSPTLAIVFSNLSGDVVLRCSHVVSTSADLTGCTSITARIVAGYVYGTVLTHNASNMPTLPTGINHSGITEPSPVPSGGVVCTYARATNQNDGTFVSAFENLSRFHYYLCVVPTDGTSTPANVWSGTILIGGVPTTGNYYVCRYQYNSADNVNARNVQPYVDVSTSIDNQNYYVANHASGSCSGIDISGHVTGVLHQDCRTSNPARATVCPAASP
jgi:type IV pilus modification protein PilV